MAHRAKAALAHSSPIKPGSATLSSSAKWHQNHAPKVATLCQIAAFFHDNVTSPSRAAGQRGPRAENRERGRTEPRWNTAIAYVEAPCQKDNARTGNASIVWYNIK
jgi:hypothetical protein